MLESKGRQWRLPCRRRVHNIFKCETLNSSRNLNSIMTCQRIHASSAINLKIMFKYTQLIIVWTIIMRQHHDTSMLCIMTALSSKCGGVLFFFRSKVFTINCIFFATRYIPIINCFLCAFIWSWVMTLWLDDESTALPPKAATQSEQLTRTRQAGRGPLLQTANDKLGIWQGHWDSHFHEHLQWLYKHWLGLRRISSFKKNVESACQCIIMMMPHWHWRPCHN